MSILPPVLEPVQEAILTDDRLRTVYQQAILTNRSMFKDKTVLDIGCGTGLLSMLAAKAGASRVVGIDTGRMFDEASGLIEANGFSEMITLVTGNVKDTELPIKEFDIIISVWMGYFLLHESLLEDVLFARDKYLRKDGKMFPNKALLRLSAFSATEYKEEIYNRYNDICGELDYSSLARTLLCKPAVDEIDPRMEVAPALVYKQFDLHTIKIDDLTFTVNFKGQVIKDDFVAAFAGWFDVEFYEGKKKTFLSTMPGKNTHWHQVLFYLPDTLSVAKDDTIEGTFAYAPNVGSNPTTNISISYHVGESAQGSQQYTMF